MEVAKPGKTERGSEPVVGVGDVGAEKGMVVHVEGQGQAVALKGAGKEVEVGRKGFTLVEVASVQAVTRANQTVEETPDFIGAPGRTRTCNLLIRSGVLI